MSTYRSSVISVSWLPTQAIPMSLLKVPVMLGIAHYDAPPPDRLDDLDSLHAGGAFRFANRLSVWVEFEDGEIVDAGYEGGGLMSATVADFKVTEFAFPPVAHPDVQREPEYGDGWVRFVQTTGGRTGSPMPRRISRPPFVRVAAPLVWTTLSLTIDTDGQAEFEVIGASSFPRHWFYDPDGTLMKKSGIADYEGWADDKDEGNSPWDNQEHNLLVADAESELERSMSATIMKPGSKPRFRRLGAGETLIEQGHQSSELYLILDGMLTVEADGEVVAEVGPGAIMGEQAALEGGHRSATVRAVTPVRVAVTSADQLNRDAIEELARLHRGG